MMLPSIAELFEAAAAAIAAFRMYQLGLHRTQKAMVAFLAITSAYLFFLGSISPRSATYFWAYIVTTALGWGLGTSAVRELFSLALQNYPGLRSATRGAMYVSVFGAAVISLAAGLSTWSGGRAGRSHLFYIQTVNRAVVLTLAAYIALFLLLLSRYPLRLHRNILVSCGFFCAAFLSEAGAMLVDTMSPYLYHQTVDTSQVFFAGLCMTGWAAILRPHSGEQRVVRQDTSHEFGLLRELDAMNAFVTRASRL